MAMSRSSSIFLKLENCAHIGNLSYTEDDILIYTIYVSNLPPNVEEDELRQYFETFGRVENVKVIHRLPEKNILRPRFNNKHGFKFGFVHFTDPESASSALRKNPHIIGNFQLNVRSADSWKQPHQKRLQSNSNLIETDTPDDPNLSDANSMLNLNDDCLFMIFKYLPFIEQIKLSTLCQRLQSIFQLLYKTKKTLKIDLAQPLTLMNFREGLIQMGQYIERITFSSGLSMKNFTRFIDFVSQYCPNLHHLLLDSLHFKYNDVFRKIALNLKSITHLELKDCSINDDMIRLLSNIPTIQSLDLTQNYEVTGKYLDKFDNLKRLILNSCANIQPSYFQQMCNKTIKLKELNIRRCDRLNISAFEAMITNLNELEILTVCTCYQTSEFERITELKSLKNLTVHNSNIRTTDYLFAKLANNKADQLEVLKVTNFSYTAEKANSIIELKKLKQIDLPFVGNMTGEFLIQLAKLPELKILTIPGCFTINTVDILRFIEKSNKIDFIDVSKIFQLNNDFVLETIDVLRKLNRLTPLTLKIGSDNIHEDIKQNPKYISASDIIKLDFNTTDYVMEMYDDSLNDMSDSDDYDPTYDEDDAFDTTDEEYDDDSCWLHDEYGCTPKYFTFNGYDDE